MSSKHLSGTLEKIVNPLLSVLFFLVGALVALEVYYQTDMGEEVSSLESLQGDPTYEWDELEARGNGEVKGNGIEKLVMEGTSFQTELYINRGSDEGPTVLVVGGIHGDEPSGYNAAEEVVDWEVEKGTLLVLPYANPPAIDEKSRYAEGKRDLNRAFLNLDSNDKTGRAAQAIDEVVKRYRPDWILDLHSARGFHRVNPSRLGQTLIFNGSKEGEKLINRVKENVNRRMDVEKHRYTIIGPAVRGTLIRESHIQYGANGAIIESSRELSLYKKTKYHLRVVREALNQLNLK